MADFFTVTSPLTIHSPDGEKHYVVEHLTASVALIIKMLCFVWNI